MCFVDNDELAGALSTDALSVGDLVRCEVVDSAGVDLVVRPVEVLPRSV